MLVIIILSVLLAAVIVMLYMKINEVTTHKTAHNTCMKDFKKKEKEMTESETEHKKEMTESETKHKKEMTESETKHKKEMTKIKNKLDRLIKKDLSKIKRLDKKKYYKIFEKFFDDLNSKIPKDLDKTLKMVKKSIKKNKKGLEKNNPSIQKNPSLKMIKMVKKSIKEFKKNLINLNNFKRANDRVVEYYFYNVLKKYNLEESKDDILFKKSPVFKAYRNLIRKDIKKNDLMRKMIFIHVLFKNEMIKSDKNFKNSMTDEKLIKLYNKLPYRKSIFDIIFDTIEYFSTQYPIDLLEYLISLYF